MHYRYIIFRGRDMLNKHLDRILKTETVGTTPDNFHFSSEIHSDSELTPAIFLGLKIRPETSMSQTVFEPVISESAQPTTISTRTSLRLTQMLFSRLNKQYLHVQNGSLSGPI